MSFGSQSAYYALYQKSPARARKALWKVFQDTGRRIRETARRMGCSTHTVQALVRRLARDPKAWSNRPAVPREGSLRRPRLHGASLTVVPTHVLAGTIPPHRRAGIACFIFKSAAG